MSATQKMNLVRVLEAKAQKVVREVDYYMDFVKVESSLLRRSMSRDNADVMLDYVETLHNKLCCLQALLMVRDQLEKEIRSERDEDTREGTE